MTTTKRSEFLKQRSEARRAFRGDWAAMTAQHWAVLCRPVGPAQLGLYHSGYTARDSLADRRALRR